MRVSLRIFGLELIDLELSTTEYVEAAEETRTVDQTGAWLGFTPTPGDQRWEPCADYGEDDEE